MSTPLSAPRRPTAGVLSWKLNETIMSATMKQMEALERAISIAVDAHRGQRDRYGAPYILHPLRVMARVHGGAEKIVAILHDVVEDTDWTFADLRRQGFSPEVLEALDCVTKRKGETYEDFVRRSATNPLARSVKLADLEDNMDVRRLSRITPRDQARLAKYLKAWTTLSSR